MPARLQSRGVLPLVALAMATGVFLGSQTDAWSAASGSPAPAPSAEIDVIEEMSKGLAALDAADYPAAEDAFEAVLGVEENNGDARAYLGIAQLGQEDYDASKSSLEQAIEDGTVLPQAHESLGVVYLHFDDVDKAREQLASLEAMLADCAEPCALSDDIQSSQAALQSAIDAHESGDDNAFLLSPTNNVDREYANAVRHINAGDYATALELLVAMNDARPGNADVLNYLGFTHRKTGQLDEALLYYRQALAIDPDHAGANEYLGELYVQLGDIDKAKEQLARLDEICTFACVQYEELKRWVDEYQSASVD